MLNIFNNDIASFLDIVGETIGSYFRGQLLLALLVGFLVGAGMKILHVPFPLLLGMLAFFLEFIPIIGALVSGAAAILLALTQSPLLALIVFFSSSESIY